MLDLLSLLLWFEEHNGQGQVASLDSANLVIWDIGLLSWLIQTKMTRPTLVIIIFIVRISLLWHAEASMAQIHP